MALLQREKQRQTNRWRLILIQLVLSVFHYEIHNRLTDYMSIICGESLTQKTSSRLPRLKRAYFILFTPKTLHSSHHACLTQNCHKKKKDSIKRKHKKVKMFKVGPHWLVPIPVLICNGQHWDYGKKKQVCLIILSSNLVTLTSCFWFI